MERTETPDARRAALRSVAIASRALLRVSVTLLELTATDALLVEAERLAPGARVVPTRIETVEGSLSNRSLRATFSRLALPLGPVLGLQPIDDATILLSLDPAGRLTTGELGAALTVPTFTGLFERAGVTLDEATVRSIAHPDLAPDASGVCQRISLGVGLEVVPIELVDAP